MRSIQKEESIMNNNIKMTFTNTTAAFANTHSYGNTANTISTNYLRKNTENAYAKCKADMERRKQRDYIIKHGSLSTKQWMYSLQRSNQICIIIK